jgi:hypothetical protein
MSHVSVPWGSSGARRACPVFVMLYLKFCAASRILVLLIYLQSSAVCIFYEIGDYRDIHIHRKNIGKCRDNFEMYKCG